MIAEEYNLDDEFVCICGDRLIGRDVLKHYKIKHPVLHKDVCKRLGIDEKLE